MRYWKFLLAVWIGLFVFPATAQDRLGLFVDEQGSLTGSHVVLAGDDGEGMIFFPQQVEEGPDGNLYVLDSGDSFIKVFSPDGRYLRKIGGQGEGPGEFQRTEGASFGFMAGNRLFFTEFIGGHHWITILDLDGNLLRVLSVQQEVMFGVRSAVPLDDGGFLVHFAYNSVPRAEGDYYLYDWPQSLAAVDSTGAIVSEVVHTNHTMFISSSPSGGTTSLPFTPVFAWAPAGNGEVIWSDGMSSRLQVLSYTGKLVREIETPLGRPEKVSTGELRRWKARRKEMMKSRDPVWWNRFGRVIEKYDKPLYDKPVLHAISMTPQGHLLVNGTTGTDTDGPTCWLLDDQGQLMKKVTAAAWDVHFSAHFLLFVTFDEEENPLVHAVEYSGDEVAALSRLGEIGAGFQER